jgi:hypothetical protein
VTFAELSRLCDTHAKRIRAELPADTGCLVVMFHFDEGTNRGHVMFSSDRSPAVTAEIFEHARNIAAAKTTDDAAARPNTESKPS